MKVRTTVFVLLFCHYSADDLAFLLELCASFFFSKWALRVREEEAVGVESEAFRLVLLLLLVLECWFSADVRHFPLSAIFRCNIKVINRKIAELLI